MPSSPHIPYASPDPRPRLPTSLHILRLAIGAGMLLLPGAALMSIMIASYPPYLPGPYPDFIPAIHRRWVFHTLAAYQLFLAIAAGFAVYAIDTRRHHRLLIILCIALCLSLSLFVFVGIYGLLVLSLRHNIRYFSEPNKN